MDQAKKNPTCKCGKRSELRSFTTFSYFYCTACKNEVSAIGEKPPVGVNDGWADHTSILARLASPSTGQMPKFMTPSPVYTPSAMPAGYVALKGDEVTCANCGALHGTLTQDLPHLPTRLSSASYYADWVTTFVFKECCPNENETRYVPSVKAYEFHVKNRGWV